MTVLDDVFGSLAAMSLLQLLLAFVACTGYTLAQGRLIAPRARRIASATTAMAALAFVLLGGAWARSTILIAFAIAGLGAFIAIVWLSGRLLGLAPAQAQAVQAADSGHGEDPIILESDATTAPGSTRPRPRRTPMSSA